jgi:flagellar motor switch protein FliG
MSPATPLPDVRKAAILLTCLPEEQAADLLGRLSRQQAEAVTVQIARLGQLSADETESVVRDFADASPYDGQAGGIELARSLVEKALGRQKDGEFDGLKETLDALPFHFLKRVDPQAVVISVRDEHPQTIALILVHLPPDYAARVLAGLSAERQIEVLRRIAGMGPTSPEVIEEVEHGLESRLAGRMNAPQQQPGGAARAARILSAINGAAGESLLASLAARDPSLAEQIRVNSEVEKGQGQPGTE